MIPSARGTTSLLTRWVDYGKTPRGISIWCYFLIFLYVCDATCRNTLLLIGIMTVVCCSLSWLCCTVTFACTCCIPFLVRDPLFCCSLAAIIIPLSLPSTPSLLPFLSPLLPPFLLPSHLHLPRFFTHIHHPAAPHLSRPQKLLQALLITLLRGHRRCLPHVSPLVTQPRARLQPPGKKVINYNTKIYYSGDLFSD